jgi:hypothetical protein
MYITLSSNIMAGENCLYVDPIGGNDANPGTETMSLSTLNQAAIIINQNSKAAFDTIQLAPGIYNLDRTMILQNTSVYTGEKRLIITAKHCPDDPGWNPSLMPTILSTAIPKNHETISIQINMSHVSFCGLRFLGNPSLKNYHAVIARTEAGLKDLFVTQCVFIGDKNSLDIYTPVIGVGDELVVDHCVFLNCHASVVFWDGLDGIVGKKNAMRHCIIYGGYIGGPWTCQTSNDFEFRNNVIANCKFAWIRNTGNHQRYTMKNCVITNCDFLSVHGNAFGPFHTTGEDVSFIKDNVIEEGQVSLVTNNGAQNYFQLANGSIGSNLRAGLFTK